MCTSEGSWTKTCPFSCCTEAPGPELQSRPALSIAKLSGSGWTGPFGSMWHDTARREGISSTCSVKETSDTSCKRLRLLNLRQELLRVVERHVPAGEELGGSFATRSETAAAERRCGVVWRPQTGFCSKRILFWLGHSNSKRWFYELSCAAQLHCIPPLSRFNEPEQDWKRGATPSGWQAPSCCANDLRVSSSSFITICSQKEWFGLFL